MLKKQLLIATLFTLSTVQTYNISVLSKFHEMLVGVGAGLMTFDDKIVCDSPDLPYGAGSTMQKVTPEKVKKHMTKFGMLSVLAGAGLAYGRTRSFTQAGSDVIHAATQWVGAFIIPAAFKYGFTLFFLNGEYRELATKCADGKADPEDPKVQKEFARIQNNGIHNLLALSKGVGAWLGLKWLGSQFGISSITQGETARAIELLNQHPTVVAGAIQHLYQQNPAKIDGILQQQRAVSEHLWNIKIREMLIKRLS